jgi:glycerol-3-phosphate dehydrogenase
MTAQVSRNAETDLDVIIIGAGINGAGIARDAAMRGLKVLLLDKGDIGGGTSSVSTRLIHGGLRYLEHGELGLVRESLRERETLFRIAPHLITSLALLIPIYQNRRRGWFTIRAGMIAYDLLSFDKSLPLHRMLSPAETLQHAPGLNTEGLLGAALYFDRHVVFAERLVLENVLSARAHEATVLTYARVDAFTIEGGKIGGVEFTDLLTGEKRHARASIVVNAAGPWVDSVLSRTGAKATRLIGGTKGSHIVVAPFPAAPTTAVYAEAETDHRPFFIIPWNRNYLIGTTDIRFDGNLDQIRIDDAETDYLLQETNRLFPQAGLRRESILYAYSGVRPLASTDGSKEDSITRRHFVIEHPTVAGLVSIVGGKLTTYRRLAEETVDLVARKLGKQVTRCATAETPLPGAASENLNGFCDEFSRESSLPTHTNERLLRIYGTRAAEVLQLALADSSLAEVFDQESGAIGAEVVFAFEYELARTLADCLLRRTMLGLNSTCGLNVLDAASEILRSHLGWSDDRVGDEVLNYRKTVQQPGMIHG